MGSGAVAETIGDAAIRADVLFITTNAGRVVAARICDLPISISEESKLDTDPVDYEPASTGLYVYGTPLTLAKLIAHAQPAA